MTVGGRLAALRLAPDGRPRPDAPFGRGPLAARVLRGAILGASAVVSRAPVGVVAPLATVGGTIEWAVRPAKRRRLATNLSHAVGAAPGDPRVRALVRKEILSEARRSADFLWAAARPDELVATTQIVGREHLEAALAHGRGVLLVSTHLGGWEVATALAKEVVPVPTTVLVTDDWLAWAVEGLRVRAGLRLAYDSDPAARVARLLRDGEAVLVLGDYAKPWMRTHPVRLLDAVAELPAGVAVLSRLCQSPVLPFAVLPTAPRRWRVEIEPSLGPPPRHGGEAAETELLQQLADRWSVQLRRHPEHWAAVYPMRWRDA
jgi:KDO2-lipid IV(A) lauroyltransferase